MRTSKKNTIIAGVFSLIVGFIGGKVIGINNKQDFKNDQNLENNQTFNIVLDGELQTISPDDYIKVMEEKTELSSKIYQLKVENSELVEKNKNLNEEILKINNKIKEMSMQEQENDIIYLNEEDDSDNLPNEKYINLLSQQKPYYMTDYVELVSDDNNITMAGNDYYDGIKICADGYFVLFNLDGKYKKLKFDIGHVDYSRMNTGKVDIYLDNLDTNPVKTIEVDPEGLVQTFEMDLDYALQMKIKTTCDSQGVWFGIVNMRVME